MVTCDVSARRFRSTGYAGGLRRCALRAAPPIETDERDGGVARERMLP